MWFEVVVLPDDDASQHGLLRVIDEWGEDCLYPADYFLLVGFPCPVRETLALLVARTAA